MGFLYFYSESDVSVGCLITSLLTYLLTPWCRVLEKLTDLQLVKKFPAFHGTRRFITALASVRQLSLSWASQIQSIFTSRFCLQSKRVFLNMSVLQGGVVSTSPNPQAEGPPLVVGCPRLLIQYIHSYPPYRRPFVYPQPEEVPCRGDRPTNNQLQLEIDLLH